jgi:hypothetical protein
MEIVRFSETLASTDESTRRQNPENNIIILTAVKTSNPSLILFSQPWIGLVSGLWPSVLLNKIMYEFLVYPVRATRHAHVILLDFIAVFDKDYKV